MPLFQALPGLANIECSFGANTRIVASSLADNGIDKNSDTVCTVIQFQDIVILKHLNNFTLNSFPN